MTVETRTEPITEPMEVVAPADKPKPLKLSEAIRFGGMSTEQIFGEFGDANRTCAIGAANVAFGREPGDGDLISVLEGRQVDALPCDHGYEVINLAGAIIHLNDDDRMPREKIADWLESKGL